MTRRERGTHQLVIWKLTQGPFCVRLKDALKEKKRREEEPPIAASFYLPEIAMHQVCTSPRQPTALIITSLFLALLLGCSTPYEKMSEVERARLLTQLRKEADEYLGRFKKSEEDPNGVDIDSLMKYVDLHRQTTEIAPTSCPLCFARYGQALGFLAGYYRDLVAAFEKELKTASPKEKPVLEAKIKKYRQEMIETFQRSNRHFQVYFNTNEAVDPFWYYWVVGQYEMLQDYRRAIYYLDLYAGGFPLNENQKKEVAQLRKTYQEEERRKEEEDLRRELEKEEKPGARRPTGGHQENAN